MRTFNTGREDATLGPLRASVSYMRGAVPSMAFWSYYGVTTGPLAANASSIHGELIHGELIIIALNNSSHFGIKLNYFAVQGAPLHRSRYSGLVLCVHSRD